MDSGYDTNLGWWTEKPERPRPGFLSRRPVADHRVRKPYVWQKAAFIVALMVAFFLSLVSLANWLR